MSRHQLRSPYSLCVATPLKPPTEASCHDTKNVSRHPQRPSLLLHEGSCRDPKLVHCVAPLSRHNTCVWTHDSPNYPQPCCDTRIYVATWGQEEPGCAHAQRCRSPLHASQTMSRPVMCSLEHACSLPGLTPKPCRDPASEMGSSPTIWSLATSFSFLFFFYLESSNSLPATSWLL